MDLLFPSLPSLALPSPPPLLQLEDYQVSPKPQGTSEEKPRWQCIPFTEGLCGISGRDQTTPTSLDSLVSICVAQGHLWSLKFLDLEGLRGTPNTQGEAYPWVSTIQHSEALGL